MWEDADLLATTANYDQKQFSLVLSALNGKASAVMKVISYGVNINEPSRHLYSHATALHHAVCSGSLDTVKVLVKAGSRLDIKDSIYDGTPLGWAEYLKKKDILLYLRERVQQNKD
jgi:peptide-methionine (S)-S-oxide reductase